MSDEKHHHEIGERADKTESNDVEYLLSPLKDIDSWDKEDHVPTTLVTPTIALKRKIRRVVLLYNPHSGSQKGALLARKVEVLLTKYGIYFETLELERKGHAEEMAQSMSIEGVDAVCILGGDGTFHECINGWMKRDEKDIQSTPLALIPGGTGNSFVLELLGATKVKKSVQHIIRGIYCPIDITKVVCGSGDKSEVIYSFNSIHWGLASKVNVTAEKLRWMGKAVRYPTAALMELMRGETRRAKIVLQESDDNIVTYDEEFCLVIANNIGATLKGMKIAPKAKLNDGLIDILLVRSSSTFDLMNIFTKLYDGSHTDLSYVEYKQVKSFSIALHQTIDTDPIEEIIDIDGELRGSTPFTCTVLPKALRVIM